jgi:formate dehydrogenase accessory protein FdhD
MPTADAEPAGLGADLGLGYGPPSRRRALLHLEGERVVACEASVAEEVPAAFVYAGRSHAVMMCTPADLEDLAVGFTLTEGIVDAAADVGAVRVARHSRGVELAVDVPPAAAERLLARARTIAGRTGCGLCGVEAIDEAVRPPRRVSSALRVAPAALWRAGAALEAHQPLNAETRAVHAAAWCGADGEPRVVREDVGRHNALDKVIGALVRAGVDPGDGFVVVTSRASFELVQKAATAGVPLLAAVSRPTGLAARLAERAGLTLVALLRGERADVHAHPERLL